MYFIHFLLEIPKISRFPLQGIWQNVVLPLNVHQTSHEHSIFTPEAMDPRKTPETFSDRKYSTPELLCFLPDADIQRCAPEADNSLKNIARESNASPVAIDAELIKSSATLCNIVDMEDFESDDSDITLDDIASYAYFENDEFSNGSDTTPKPQLRRRLPLVKRRKYDHVQSKVKQYIKSNAGH
ncbi:uncharacterized protein LOC125766301 [Anopheles funestus]|uniref:uncharacterized protein LOC125766301 n=1 Tax=Anopheles funestus TaxID=62324 RepID=UPI0020C63D30|nr:uncharacterized protein LOC125766301 [Anopheles funestus]